MKYKQRTYESWNPFSGDDTEVKVYSWKMVKTRKPHGCCLADMVGNESYHEIPSGSLVMKEHAIIEGEWASTYSCMECMDKWMEELEIMEYFKE